jgi:uncharacterized membrane protein YbhN (UPF0104 family)
MRALVIETLSTVARARPGFALLALALYFASFAAVAWRWCAVVSGLGGRLGLGSAASLLYAGVFASNVTPARIGGEVLRVTLVRGRAGLDTRRAVASVAWDRLADLAALSALMLVSAISLGGVLVAAGRARVIAIAAVAIAVVLAIAARKVLPRMMEPLSWARIDRRAFARAVAIGLLAWALDLLRYVAIAASFGVALSPVRAATLSVAQALGGLAPVAGGLGVVDGGLIGALRLYGVDLDAAIAITLFERGITLVLASAIGAVMLGHLGGMKLLRRARRPVEADEAPRAQPPPGDAG